MIAAQEETPRWSAFKWSAVIGAVYLIQLAGFLIVGRRQSPPPPPTGHGIQVVLEANPSATGDPMLLVRPDVTGFSPDIGGRGPSSVPWPGQPGEAELQHPVKPPGEDVAALGNNAGAPLSVVVRAKPEASAVSIPVFTTGRSTFRIEGDLASRPLVSQPNLISPVSDTALSNTVVQIDADASGRVFDPPVILSHSGSVLADSNALVFARALQFQPVAGTGAGRGELTRHLTWGTVIFDWRAQPAPQP